MKTLNLFLLIVIALSTFGCGPDEEPGTDCTQGYDQKAMFQDLTIDILRDYADFKTFVEGLNRDLEFFLSDTNEETLKNLRVSTTAAYENFQSVALYEFGPAAEVFLRNSLNNFPVNIDKVKNNIATESWNFDLPDEFDKGFPALDYLLFGISDNPSDVVFQFKDAPDAEKRRHYLVALIADIKNRFDHTTKGWETYQEDFENNTGTADGSSLSLFINCLNQHFELIKREKIGFPSGALTSGFPNPEAEEAVYSGFSLTLMNQALNASQRNFSFLEKYLTTVNAQKNGTPLSQLINDQYELIDSALIPIINSDFPNIPPLSQVIETDQAAVDNLYQSVSDLVVYLKTDMPSVLCVSITYIDNPSDSD